MEVILTTLSAVPGKTITKSLGIVQGSTVRAKHVGHDIFAGLKNFVGGEIESYTQLLAEARAQAMDRLSEKAKEMGADAVLNIRIMSSTVAAGASEIVVYGTAVKFTE